MPLICASQSNRSEDMGIFQLLKIAAARHLRILKIRNFKRQSNSKGQYAHYAKFRTIGQTVPKMWPFFDFSRWRPSAILDF